MRLRTWHILALGFGTIVLLTFLLALDSWRQAGQIYDTAFAIHESHTQTQEALREIESGIYLSGLYVRDFLLDPSQIAAGLHRRELVESRSSMEKNLEALDHMNASPHRAVLDQLRREVDRYWDSLDPVFEWSPAQKLAFSTLFLRKQVLPRRTAVLEMANKVKALAAADLEQRRREMSDRVADQRRSRAKRLIIVLLIVLVVAAGSIWRTTRLENRAERERGRTELAEREMRRLSHKLVHAQEAERRSIARELHDEVGQMLTALRVELGTLEKLRQSPGDEFRTHLEDARNLAAQTLNSVRSLASGLRPSMLDDLGLGPALQWQAREFSRRTGVPVDVTIDGLPDALPEEHRTCLYRAVQEALTNCARHAEATQIGIALHGDGRRVALTIQDDGRGMPPYSPGADRGVNGGLGLIGMEERVRELGGSLHIQSQPGQGTSLKVTIPLPAEAAH